MQIGRDYTSTSDVAEKLAEFTSVDHMAGVSINADILQSIVRAWVIAGYETHAGEPELIVKAKEHFDKPTSCVNIFATVPGRAAHHSSAAREVPPKGALVANSIGRK